MATPPARARTPILDGGAGESNPGDAPISKIEEPPPALRRPNCSPIDDRRLRARRSASLPGKTRAATRTGCPLNPALTEPASPDADLSADDPAVAPAAKDADPPNDDDDDDDDDEEAASPAHSEPPLAKAVSDSIEKKKRKRGGDGGGDAKGEEEKTADAKADPDEAGNGRAKALKRDDESAVASAPAAAAQTAPSFDMPPITIDPSTGKASVEINVKGNEGRVIGKGGETVKHIERKFAVKIEMRRERGTCVVTGAEAVMRDAAALISEVIERGDVNKGERAVAG